MPTDFVLDRETSRETLISSANDLRKKGVEELIVQFPDTTGALRSKIGPLKVSEGGEAVNAIFYNITHGEGAPLGDITFVSQICSEEEGYPSILGLMDGDSFRQYGWEPRRASVLLNTYLRNGARCPVDQRSLVANAEADAKELGFEAQFAVEYEFGVFVEDETAMRSGKYSRLEPWGNSLINYNLARTNDQQDFAAEFFRRMLSIGVKVPSLTTEYGHGMYEFALPPTSPLRAADNAARARYHIKEMCAERGLVATFMTRFQPMGKESASGAHHHVSLWHGDTPLTVNESGAISPLAQSFLAGLLERLPETHLMFRPTINSYRRFDKNAWSPEDVSWGFENRMAAVRVITGPTSKAGRFEHRVAGSDASPYLAITAILAAGCDGVRSSLELKSNGPGQGKMLSQTLRDAIVAFTESSFVADVFGQDFVEHFVASRCAEQDAFDNWLAQHVTEFEWKRYFLGT